MNKSDICEIIAVRHGETVANKSGVLQGQYNTPLNENGILQARAIAERLKKRSFDMVFTSDLDRAHDTAKIIAEFHPQIKVTPTASLREWDLGVLQGRPYSELIVEYPDIMNAFKKPGKVPPIPGGEDIGCFQQRISSFMDETARANCGKTLLFVSHGGAMQRMLVHAMGEAAPQNIYPLCDNASLSIFRFRGGQWQLITWNDTSHLDHLELNAIITY